MVKEHKEQLDPEKRREKIFKSFIDSNGEEWEEIFSLEKTSLYDYVLRMTGNILGTSESLEEVFVALKRTNSRYATYQELRVALFATVRSFNAHVWNAESSKTIKPSVSLEPIEINSIKAHQAKQEMLRVERSLSELVPWERETVILNMRECFSFAEISIIMSMDQKVVMSNFYSALRNIKRDCAELGEKVTVIITTLPKYHSPARTAFNTLNLSAFIEDLKAARSKPLKTGIFLLFLLLFGVLAAAVYHYFIGDVFLLLNKTLDKTWHLLKVWFIVISRLF